MLRVEYFPVARSFGTPQMASFNDPLMEELTMFFPIGLRQLEQWRYRLG